MKRNRFRDSVVIPGVLFLGLLVAVVAVWDSLERRRLEDIAVQTARTTEQVAIRLEEHLGAHLRILRYLRLEWYRNNINNPADFAAAVLPLQTEFSGFQAINYIDPRGVIRWVNPEETNPGVQDKDLHTHPEAAATFILAEKTRTDRATPPLTLWQGGLGFATYFPLVREGELEGYLNGVFRIHSFMADYFKKGISENFSLCLSEKGRRFYTYGDTTGFSKNLSRDYIFRVLDREWKVTLSPQPEFMSTRPLFYNRLFLLVSILSSAIFAGVVRLLLLQRLDIKASEAQYRQLVNDLPDGIAIHQGGKFVFVNRAGCELVKARGPEDLLGKPVMSVVHPDFRGEVAERIRVMLEESGNVAPLHEKFLRFDGEVIDVEVAARRIEYNGEPSVQVIVRDITAAKQSDEKLRESRIQLQATLNSTDDGILVVNEQGQVILSNRRFAEMWRIPQSLLQAGDDQQLLEFVAEQLVEPQAFRSKVQELYGTKKEAYDTLHFKDGRVFERFSTPLLKGKAGLGRLWSFRDITDRQHNETLNRVLFQIAEAATSARDLDSLYKTIYRLLSEVINTRNFYIALYDPERDLLSFPFYVDEVDEYPEPDKPGNGLTEYVLRTGKSLFITRVELFRMAERGEIEVMGSPSELWLGTPLKIEDRIVGVIAVQSYSDLEVYKPEDLKILEYVSGQIADAIIHKQSEDTIRESEERHRRLSDELLQANSMKELLLDVITHDLKNPAGVIRGVAEILEEEHPKDEKIRLVSSSSEHLLQVIENATTLSNVSMGEEIEKRELDLAAIIAESLGEFQALLKNSGLELETRIPAGLKIHAHPIIAEVFKNYVSNAIRYSAPGKKLVIEAEQDAGYTLVEVKDLGTTVPAEMRDLIFKRSVQLDPKHSRGRGLGLAIVKRIADAHNAEVGVLPNIPTGNNFYLRIPDA